MADQIGDRVGLAGAGRPLHDKAVARCEPPHYGDLVFVTRGFGKKASLIDGSVSTASPSASIPSWSPSGSQGRPGIARRRRDQAFGEAPDLRAGGGARLRNRAMSSSTTCCERGRAKSTQTVGNHRSVTVWIGCAEMLVLPHIGAVRRQSRRGGDQDGLESVVPIGGHTLVLAASGELLPDGVVEQVEVGAAEFLEGLQIDACLRRARPNPDGAVGPEFEFDDAFDQRPVDRAAVLPPMDRPDPPDGLDRAFGTAELELLLQLVETGVKGDHPGGAPLHHKPSFARGRRSRPRLPPAGQVRRRGRSLRSKRGSAATRVRRFRGRGEILLLGVPHSQKSIPFPGADGLQALR